MHGGSEVVLEVLHCLRATHVIIQSFEKDADGFEITGAAGVVSLIKRNFLAQNFYSELDVVAGRVLRVKLEFPGGSFCIWN
eukprot:9598614-Karenia_brevis.AAC.1